MNFFLQLPFELRLILLFLAGTVVGTQLNRGIYRLAYNRRSIGPWSRPEADAPPRIWSDYLPVFGWLGLSRESSLHGTGYWVRPLLIELATGIGFAALYAWELDGALQPKLATLATGVVFNPSHMQWQCASHLLLCSLMLVATFIDFDEQTIPDEITVTGTIAALVFAAAVPVSLLPTTIWPQRTIGTLLVCPPSAWPEWMSGPGGLACGLACYLGWCAAIVPSIWTTRRGLSRAIVYQIVSLIRTIGWRPRHPDRHQPGQPLYLVLAVAGAVGIAAIWWFGGLRWQALATSLIGLAFGGSLIWGVRIVGAWALGKEAMGFGDVTLMAMIGAFLGWQPALLTFFLAPFAALFIAVAQWVVTRKHDIAFGPYLCLGALILLVRWRAIWHEWVDDIFALGWLIPAIVLICLVLMGGMLTAWQMVKSWLLKD